MRQDCGKLPCLKHLRLAYSEPTSACIASMVQATHELLPELACLELWLEHVDRDHDGEIDDDLWEGWLLDQLSQLCKCPKLKLVVLDKVSDVRFDVDVLSKSLAKHDVTLVQEYSLLVPKRRDLHESHRFLRPRQLPTRAQRISGF